MVAGIDRFLLQKISGSADLRAAQWKRDYSVSPQAEEALRTDQKRLMQILGISEPLVPFKDLELVASLENPALVGQGDGYAIYAVRWPAFADVHGEGLLLLPINYVASVVAIPDAEQTPEQLAGLVEGIPPEAQFARRLAENGCRVLVPVLINRNMGPHKGRAKITAREFIYRSAFVLGRHIIGYEIQKIQAAMAWFRRDVNSPIGVMGYGEGGMLALYAAAQDGRLPAVCVSGYFNDQSRRWNEPLDRNVFGLLNRFGDAELLAMTSPGSLIVEAAQGPVGEFIGKGGGAPARLASPPLEDVRCEFERGLRLTQSANWASLVVCGGGQGMFGSDEALGKFLKQLHQGAGLNPIGKAPIKKHGLLDFQARQERQFQELDHHNQQVLVESPYVRTEFMKKLDVSSLAAYETSAASYREIFYRDIIGRFDDPLLPPNAQTRLAYDQETWKGYEVVLDVFPEVMAYGVLLLPKDLKPGEKRPVVVCQHGLEGRPQQTIEGDTRAYHDFAARLAERGFITFAPQNPYIFGDRFRTLQRKANLLGKTLFSIITPQHQQIVNWLGTQPFVDRDRIAFYGLSYGGKTAMRVPALVTNYCLSICSGDFNDWVWKNASSRSPYSYVWTGEYEIFEWNLGSTFNYTEMAALIAPRPFMVERGHFDGVAPDEAVAYEFSKVRHLYAARLKIPERTEIEFFPGPHTINGKGTYDFLHRHLRWPVRQ